MKYVENHFHDNSIEIKVEFSAPDLMQLRFDDFTRKLNEECAESPQISDRLLLLEHVARQLESEEGVKCEISITRNVIRY